VHSPQVNENKCKFVVSALVLVNIILGNELLSTNYNFIRTSLLTLQMYLHKLASNE